MRRLAWVLFGITCVCVVIQGVLLTQTGFSVWSRDIALEEGFPIVPIGSLAGSALGALIVSGSPRHRIGWLFCVGQLGNAIGQASSAYVVLVAARGLEVTPLFRVALIVAYLFGATYTMAVLALIFLFAPEGRLPSRRWRLAPLAPVFAVAVWFGTVLGIPASDFYPGATPEFGVQTVVLLLTSSLVLAFAVGLGATALWLRLRRAEGEERHQLRWITAAALASTVTYVWVWVGELLVSPTQWYFVVPWHLAYIFVSVSVGVAILRYRLYQVDVLLTRAIVLGVLVVFVTVGYIAVVVGIGVMLSAVGAPGTGLYWVSFVATALVAVAFQPVRRHVLRWADRLVYGQRAAPYEALADLSRRLAESPSPEALPARVAEAAGRAVGAARTAVHLGVAGGDVRCEMTAIWPAGEHEVPGDGRASVADSQSASDLPADEDVAAGRTTSLPVLDHGERVGFIAVTMHAGDGLRPHERRLLDDVARQAGMAFRTVLLESELALRVAELRARSAALSASRRRLVRAEDEERERLSAAIQRRVVPHLRPIIDGLGHRLDGSTPTTVHALAEEAERALDELRTVVRGVFPALLARRGLVPALAAELETTRPLAVLEVDGSVPDRLDPDVEAAAYLFCVQVAPVEIGSTVRLAASDELTAVVLRNGSPSTARTLADGWQHATDRVEALGGAVAVEPQPGGLLVRARLPLRTQPADGADGAVLAHTASSRSGPNVAFEM